MDKSSMNLGTPPAMKIGGGGSMMTPCSVDFVVNIFYFRIYLFCGH
jgi:hypothetical protein